ELLIEDIDSMDSESVTHNWLDFKDVEFNATHWEPVGKPKIVFPFSPDVLAAMPIFGSRAVVVRNANYVRQYVSKGVSAGTTFTVSGLFRREWRKDPGIPRIEVWHVLASGDRDNRIVNSVFPRVRNDYRVDLRATTFEVPSTFGPGDSLEVIISGGDADWVQCDGVQMVDGNRPSVYMPEDSVWNT